MARWNTSRSSRTTHRRLHREERVGAQTEPEGLDGQHLAGRDVAEVDVAAEHRDEARLQVLGRSLEQQPVDAEAGGDDGVDDGLAELTVGTADPAAPALTRLGDHHGGAGIEILADAVDPRRRRHGVGASGVLEAHLAHDAEGVGALADVARLLGVREWDGAVRHLDEVALPVPAQTEKGFEAVLHDELLEQSAAETEPDVVPMHAVDLSAEIGGD